MDYCPPEWLGRAGAVGQGLLGEILLLPFLLLLQHESIIPHDNPVTVPKAEGLLVSFGRGSGETVYRMEGATRQKGIERRRGDMDY